MPLLKTSLSLSSFDMSCKKRKLKLFVILQNGRMKVVVLLLLCIAAGSQASFLDDLKNAFHNIGTSLTTTINAVGDQAKVVGQNLLTTASEQGKQLASQALQSEQCAINNNST